jgi:hypothetical protein
MLQRNLKLTAYVLIPALTWSALPRLAMADGPYQGQYSKPAYTAPAPIPPPPPAYSQQPVYPPPAYPPPAYTQGYGAQPSADEMAIDGLIMRPLSFAATVVGAAVFIATLPFSAFGGNVHESASTLVGEPARQTFTECLGCLPHEYRDR